MGEADGDAVGVLVDDTEGLEVEPAVGEAEGDADGEVVGAWVGCVVESAVGDAVRPATVAS